MLKIHTTVLAAITFFSISFSASAKAEAGTPCQKPGEANLKTLNDVDMKFAKGIARSNSILTYPETEVLCDTILDNNNGDSTLGFIKKYSRKIPSRDSKDFLYNYSPSILCYGRPLIYFTLYRGHDDDVQALLDAGYKVNDIIEDNRGRKMTMLDYIRIVYNSEKDPGVKELIKLKMRKIRRAGGKTCEQLDKECVLEG